MEIKPGEGGVLEAKIKKNFQGGGSHQLHHKLSVDQAENKDQALTFRSNTIEVTGNLRDSFNGAMGSKLGKSGFKRKIPGDNRRQ